MRQLQAYRNDGEPVNIGDTVTDFRGARGVLESVNRPQSEGRSGKVTVNGREYYDRVWDLWVGYASDME